VNHPDPSEPMPPDPFNGYLVIPDEIVASTPEEEAFMDTLARHLNVPAPDVAIPLVLTRSEYEQITGEQP
jgi:hypothetical protein